MGTRATVHAKDCIACNTCASVCPVDAIIVREEGFAFADDKCISCGACCLVCPTQCITIESIKEWFEIAKKYNVKSINVDESGNEE